MEALKNWYFWLAWIASIWLHLHPNARRCAYSKVFKYHLIFQVLSVVNIKLLQIDFIVKSQIVTLIGCPMVYLKLPAGCRPYSSNIW
jgi:hypothetical protein